MSCWEWVREERDENEMRPWGEVRSWIMMRLFFLFLARWLKNGDEKKTGCGKWAPTGDDSIHTDTHTSCGSYDMKKKRSYISDSLCLSPIERKRQQRATVWLKTAPTAECLLLIGRQGQQWANYNWTNQHLATKDAQSKPGQTKQKLDLCFIGSIFRICF